MTNPNDYAILGQLVPKCRRKVYQDAVTLTDAGCWEWNGGTCRHGYAYRTVNRKNLSVYRETYRQLNGDIPGGADIDHKCRNRLCVNPHHLEAVTHAENIRRGAMAKMRGSTGAMARAMYLVGAGYRRIGRTLGVSHSTVRNYLTGATYAEG